MLCEFPKGRINMGNGKAFLVDMATEKGLQNLTPVCLTGNYLGRFENRLNRKTIQCWAEI